MKLRLFLYAAVTALLILGASALFLADRIERANLVSTLFSGAEQLEAFPRFHKIFPVTEMPPSPNPRPFARADVQVGLPERFIHKGQSFETLAFLELTDTAALLVLKDGVIIHEQYRATGGPDVQWLSMSVAKSFISALIGIAVKEGHIVSIEQPVTAYVPSLKGSAYEGVRIKDILQMSSGAAWDEDYNEPDSDINRFARIFALGGSMNQFAATLTRDTEPGTYNRYNSTDTQVLGMLLTEATKRTITDYMIEKLYHPMGAENIGYWLTDSENMEMAFAGLNLTARDYAKLGELYRNQGRLDGRQIVPAEWIAASVRADAPHLMPGENNPQSYYYPWGYGYQWWLPRADRSDYAAVGVYNQFIYVSPNSNMTIVKLSANSGYGAAPSGATDYELETIDLMRAITDANR